MVGVLWFSFKQTSRKHPNITSQKNARKPGTHQAIERLGCPKAESKYSNLLVKQKREFGPVAFGHADGRRGIWIRPTTAGVAEGTARLPTAQS